MRRGQNLVLFALFLLLLCVAILATLGVTQQARRKMELNTTADAAAYSQAVATARTFNSIALLNRSQAATMVAMAGAQSAMSFAVTYRALLSATYAGYRGGQWNQYGKGCFKSSGHPQTWFRACAPTGMGSGGPEVELAILFICDNANLAYSTQGVAPWSTCKGTACTVAENLDKRGIALRDELRDIEAKWTALDRAAGAEVLAIQAEGFAIGGFQREALAGLLAARFDQTLAPSGATLNHLLANEEVANLIAPGSIPVASNLTMGSRRHAFITRREDGKRVLQKSLDTVLAAVGAGGEATIAPELIGQSYFARSQNHGAAVGEQAAWGDEHGTVEVHYLGLTNGLPRGRMTPVPFKGWVASTDKQDATDSHSYCPHVAFVVTNANDEFETHSPEEHTLAEHQVIPKDTCPGSSCIWPDFLDVNGAVLSDAADVFGQPKAQVAASLPVDPQQTWNRAFRFAFSSNGTGTALDLKNGRNVAMVSPLPQMASTAIAYYHRPNHWKEPPNLFNPYWRATLVHADVDATGLADLQAGVAAKAPWAADAMRKLIAAGYTGIP